MLFNSINFIFFLVIVFALYWLFPKKFRWILLLAASYFFYMYWNWKLVFLILFTTLISYASGMLIEKYRDKKRIKVTVLTASMITCFGVLIFFKYFPFLSEVYSDILKVFGGKPVNGYFDIMLPVGISFYTFQTASYVIDIYKGKLSAEKHFGYYALFVSFFPQLVAGPIERPQDLLPQLKDKTKRLKEIDFSGAFRIMLIGFFKKIAIADIIGIYVNAVYEDISGATGVMVLIASLLFAVQIFCDFSGYSDIAVGCAKLFGIELTENFDSPYKSKSVKEFWSRWHISLSKWLRDYIYFPLGGSRCSKVRWALNIMVVFFVSGIWHGANYTFIVWGLLHGAFQIIGVMTLKFRDGFWRKIRVNPKGRFVGILRGIGTFLLVDFCWIFFRANSIHDAASAIVKLFADWSFTKEYFTAGMNGLGITWAGLFLTVVWIASLNILEDLKRIQFAPSKIFESSGIRYIAYLIMLWFVICSWMYLQASDVGSSFIYFQF